MNLKQNYPRDLDEEHRLARLGWILLSGLAVAIIFSAAAVDILADYVTPMSIF